jgi:hypothetical protein
MFTRIIKSIGRQWLGFLALFFILTTGSAYALAGHNTVFSDDIVNGSVRSVDVKDGNLKGDDLDESTLSTVPDASTVGGHAPSDFLGASVYKKESPVAAGTDHGDGTFIISVSCDPGDVLLSGGPANVSGTSDMVESFPTPGTTNGWTARIHKNGLADNFSVVLLCVDQA